MRRLPTRSGRRRRTGDPAERPLTAVLLLLLLTLLSCAVREPGLTAALFCITVPATLICLYQAERSALPERSHEHLSRTSRG